MWQISLKPSLTRIFIFLTSGFLLLSSDAFVRISSNILYTPGFHVIFLRVILSYLAFIVFNTIFKTKNVRDFTCGYRMYDKDAIKNFFNIIGSKYKPTSGFEMQVEIILKLRDITTSFFEIPIYLDYKKKPSESKMKVIKTIFNYLKLIANRI